ncbi:MAG: hypothetical protein ACI89X_000878 [Planctomycetota bacterium]|jgi:hypothetical protein
MQTSTARRASPLLLLVLLTLTACASTPDPMPVAPPPGPLPPLKQAPIPPSKNLVLRSATKPAPQLPVARRQSIDEVFTDEHQIVGAPADFALQPKEAVVVALPEKLGMEATEVKRTRVQIATAFLSKGHLTKDAGIYKETTFRTNTWPDGDDRTRVSETVRTGDQGATEVVTRTSSDSQPWYWSSWLAWKNDRGLRLDLRDPTSLWIKQLGKYDATKSRFFLRVFDLRFTNATANVKLNNQVPEADVTAYREALATHNKQIDQYGRDRSVFVRACDSYDDEHERRKRANQLTLKNYELVFAERWSAYEQSFRSWRLRNPDAKAQAASAPSLDLPSPIQSKQTPSTPATRAKVDDTALTALLQNEVASQVPVTTLTVLAEVVDTKTGEIAWAGEFTGFTRKSLGDRVRLLETFIEKALH